MPKEKTYGEQKLELYQKISQEVSRIEDEERARQDDIEIVRDLTQDHSDDSGLVAQLSELEKVMVEATTRIAQRMHDEWIEQHKHLYGITDKDDLC